MNGIILKIEHTLDAKMVRNPRLLEPKRQQSRSLPLPGHLDVRTDSLEALQFKPGTAEIHLIHPRTPELLAQLPQRLLAPCIPLVTILPSPELEIRVLEPVGRMQRPVDGRDGVEIARRDAPAYLACAQESADETHLRRTERGGRDEGFEMRVAEPELLALRG
ncbi:hypothetical protein RRF57_000069 [Xylaria bambusicola]|uniref:Uncharacterized protein n=1 Tax=Xylaria bambusicola TaxID=326684 RepID=A0AAN7Z262_9PEZI